MKLTRRNNIPVLECRPGCVHSSAVPRFSLWCGGYWDLVFLSYFARQWDRPPKILMLGVGGATVLQLMERRRLPFEWVGVESDSYALHVLRQGKLGRLNTPGHLVEGKLPEAMELIPREPYDILIEDVYPKLPEFSILNLLPWCGPHSVLVENETHGNPLFQGYLREFPVSLHLTRPTIENGVFITSISTFNWKDIRVEANKMKRGTWRMEVQTKKGVVTYQ